jgi:hypothetical protein
MENIPTQIETLPDGNQINVIHNDETTQCFYIDGDKKILLAEINRLKQTTMIYPTNTRIDSSFFLEPKSRVNFLFEEYDIHVEQHILDGEMYSLSGLPEVFIKTLRYGLGLKKEYKYISDAANYLEECKTIIISDARDSCIDGVNIVISSSDLEKIRKGINRISYLYSKESLQSKRLFVYNELLYNIDNKRFPEKKRDGQRDIVYRIVKDTDFSKSISKSNKRAILGIKEELDLGYFTALKAEFDKKIEGKHKEIVYQEFFEKNPLLLTMFAGSPYIQLNSKAYVGGKSFDNTGGQYPDFLYMHKITNNNFVIEIKCPSTPLLEKKYYRETGIYSPSKELSGSVAQFLTQKYQLETDIASLIKNAKDRNIEAYNVQGMVIIGSLDNLDSDNIKERKRSFELFRNNQKNLRIMTYDECQEQLNCFLAQIKENRRSGENDDT